MPLSSQSRATSNQERSAAISATGVHRSVTRCRGTSIALSTEGRHLAPARRGAAGSEGGQWSRLQRWERDIFAGRGCASRPPRRRYGKRCPTGRPATQEMPASRAQRGLRKGTARARVVVRGGGATPPPPQVTRASVRESAVDPSRDRARPSAKRTPVIEQIKRRAAICRGVAASMNVAPRRPQVHGIRPAPGARPQVRPAVRGHAAGAVEGGGGRRYRSPTHQTLCAHETHAGCVRCRHSCISFAIWYFKHLHTVVRATV